MKRKSARDREKIVFYIVLVILSFIMLYYTSLKEGFHADEIFSYGSSNCKYENVFHPYGRDDAVHVFLKENIFVGNVFENIGKYIRNPKDVIEKVEEIEKEHKPIWRTREEAKEYMTVSLTNRFNYLSVFYNQARDVHPPLFYFLVNSVASLLANTFSKYIIFAVSLPFFIGTCIGIRKIMILFHKKEFGVLAVILYGLSMGAISTMLFQRMYMMLTFFVIWDIVEHLKWIKSGYGEDKKILHKIMAITILGFLTQYYFCIFAFGIAMVIIIDLIRKKQIDSVKRYIGTLLKAALIGIVLFPPAIYHIFFSYRGVGNIQAVTNYWESLYEYMQLLANSYSIALWVIVASVVVFIMYSIKNRKQIKNINKVAILIVPSILYFLIIPKIAPYIEIRYIMCLLPLLAIGILLMVTSMLKSQKKKIVIGVMVVIIISSMGLVFGIPEYLYLGYNEYLTIAKEYNEDDFVFIGYTVYNHIQSMPEFMEYKRSLILNEEELEVLKENRELKEDKQFIVSINKWLEPEEKIKQVLEYTNSDEYEILYQGAKGVDNIIYKVSKRQ